MQEVAIGEGGERAGARGESSAARRAPLAAAAALAVMAGGAAFLAYAISRTPDPAAAPAPDETPAFAKIDAPTANDPSPAPIGIDRPAPPAESSKSAPAAPVDIGEGSKPAGADDFGGPLRINPARLAERREAAPAASSAAPAAVLSLAAARYADERDRPPPFFFESDLAPADTPRPHFQDAPDGDLADAPRELRMVLARGETFVDALRRAGVRAEDRNEAAYAIGKHYNLRRLYPGQELRLTVAEPNRTIYQAVSAKEPPALYLLSLEYRADAETRIDLARSADGSFAAKKISTPLTTRVAAIEGRIDGSLYFSAKRQGAPDEVIASLAQMFAYDVDFQREIFGGDEFEAIFEVRYDDAGKMVGGGDILYGRLKWRGRQKEKGYYRFEADGGPDYFDAAGESARRLLMKTPIDGARLSSGFGTRRHPILGYEKAHKGVDFAAARGTPIMAAGDGVVERAGPYGSFGNYVRIRHAQGYKTAYAHMNAIKKGVRTGVRVRQGDVIGYVGSTGRSTGPHLHYEVHLKDRPVNPQTLKIATGVELGGRELERFRKVRDQINAMRAPRAGEEASLLADGRAADKSL